MTNIPYDIIAKYFSNECTSEESNELMDWKNQNENNRKVFLEQEAIWKNSKSDVLFNPDVEKALAIVNTEIELAEKNKVLKPQSNKTLFYITRIAAIAIIFVVVGTIFSGVFLDFFGSQVISLNENWEHPQDTLPDGTIVYLNKQSKIIYPKKFNKSIREVTLIGEAFFEVTRDENRPFIVHTNDAEIRVLGTSFNVKAYEQNKDVQVIVETGKVKVSAAKKQDIEAKTEKSNQILEAGTMAVVSKHTKEVNKLTNSNLAYLDWRKEQIVFKQTEINKVIKTLEQIYRVEIKINDDNLKGKHLTAKFRKQSIQSIVDVIKVTFNINDTPDAPAIAVIESREKTMLAAPKPEQ